MKGYMRLLPIYLIPPWKPRVATFFGLGEYMQNKSNGTTFVYKVT